MPQIPRPPVHRAVGALCLTLTALGACSGPQVAVQPEWTPAVVFITPTAQPVEPTPAPPDIPTRAYEVQPGETLTQIARRYNLTVEELAALNGISDPNSIQVGQRIRVPR